MRHTLSYEFYFPFFFFLFLYRGCDVQDANVIIYHTVTHNRSKYDLNELTKKKKDYKYIKIINGVRVRRDCCNNTRGYRWPINDQQICIARQACSPENRVWLSSAAEKIEYTKYILKFKYTKYI